VARRKRKVYQCKCGLCVSRSTTRVACDRCAGGEGGPGAPWVSPVPTLAETGARSWGLGRPRGLRACRVCMWCTEPTRTTQTHVMLPKMYPIVAILPWAQPARWVFDVGKSVLGHAPAFKHAQQPPLRECVLPALVYPRTAWDTYASDARCLHMRCINEKPNERRSALATSP
jgi:hypothetical protein